MRENDCLSNHPRNSEQEHSGRPSGGWDVPQFENSDAEDRAQKRRDEEADPVTQARSLENGRTAIDIVDRTENPDDKAEDEQEDRVWRFHGRPFPGRIGCTMWYIYRECTTWYIGEIKCRTERPRTLPTLPRAVSALSFGPERST